MILFRVTCLCYALKTSLQNFLRDFSQHLQINHVSIIVDENSRSQGVRMERSKTLYRDGNATWPMYVSIVGFHGAQPRTE